jgi:hypothetical protein
LSSPQGLACTTTREIRPNPALELRLAYTISKTGELSSISRSQVYVEIQTGRLRAVKVGGRTLVLHEDLITWLRSRPRKTAVHSAE